MKGKSTPRKAFGHKFGGVCRRKTIEVAPEKSDDHLSSYQDFDDRSEWGEENPSIVSTSETP
jgi:hypothetical protein